MMIKFTEGLRWRKAKQCAGSSCVEVAWADSQVLLRDSKDPGVVLSFTVEEWEAFVGGVKEGEFSS